MVVAIIAALAMFGQNVDGSGAKVSCDISSVSQLKQKVDETLREKSDLVRIELASDLAESWNIECLSAGERQGGVAKEFGRLLAYRELRPYATEALYGLGDKVKSIRREIHRAYIDQNSDISRRKKLVPIITGPDIAIEHALKCLDIRARFGGVSKKHCSYISGR